jgi:hypothetical protein
MVAKTKHVEAELLAYLDGELSARERERVEAHLARCPQCTQDLATLQALREDLAFTFNAALTPVRLPYEADARIREHLEASTAHRPRLAWWDALWRRRFALTQAILAVLVVVFSFGTYQVLRIPPPPGPYETLVLGQERLSPGSEAALRVVVRATNLAGAEAALPLAGAEVLVSLVTPAAMVCRVYEGVTDANGTAEVAFTVPDDLQGRADLVVETRAPGEEGLASNFVRRRSLTEALGGLRSETSSNSIRGGLRSETSSNSIRGRLRSETSSNELVHPASHIVRPISHIVRRRSLTEALGGLRSETSSNSMGGDFTQRIVYPVTIARAYKIYLSSDKPAYRPGQTVYMRALVLDATTLKPAVGKEVTFLVLDADGEIMAQRVAAVSDFGVAALEVPLPEGVEQGVYTLRAVVGDTVSERAVTIKDYELPPFRVDLSLGKAYYMPGGTVTGTVEATYFFGKPVAQAYVIVKVYDDIPEHMVTVLTGETDARGGLTFTFDLPAMSGAASGDDGRAFTVEAEVIDRAGQRAGLRQSLPVTFQPLHILAVPESGVLKPGVENLVYLLVSDPSGRPVSATLEVTLDSAGAPVRETLTTDAYGFAILRFTPTALFKAVEVTVRETEGHRSEISPSGQTGEFPQYREVFRFETDRAPQVLLLRAERAAYTVGETLRAEVLLATSVPDDVARPVYLDVVRAGQTVAALSAPSVDGRATFALDLDGTLVGGLTLHAYTLTDEGTRVEDTRLVVVDAPRQVDVEVALDQAVYHPGETARVHIQTSLLSLDEIFDRGPSPRSGDLRRTTPPYALGLAVVDTSVYALETLPPGFARTYFMLEDVMLKRRDKVPGLDLPELLGETTEAREVQDLAARAAWAGAPSDIAYSLMQRAVAYPEPVVRPIQGTLSRGLGLTLIGVPLLLSAVVLWGLGLSGVRASALRRLGLGLLGVVLAAPLLGPIFAGGLWMSGPGARWAVWGLIAVSVALLWGFVTVSAWRRRDTRLRLSSALLATYGVLGSLLALVALRGAVSVSTGMLFLTGVAFLLMVAAMVLFGQGLILEGRRRIGWATTALALLLIPLAIATALLPGRSSELTPMLRHPGLYAGPMGWLTGCSASAPPEAVVEREATESPAEEESADEMAEREAEEGVIKVPEVEEEREAPAPATPTPLPTPSPAATPLPLPAEPYPLRHIFPETLYWDPEARTDEDGVLAFDLPLADTITTWQLTALASTREGDLGAATAEIRVFQDFFIAIDMPFSLGSVITQGQTITGTVVLYNYASTAREVDVTLAPAAWYVAVTAPAPVTVDAGDVMTTTFAIRPERAGNFELQVTAEGDGVGDAVAVGVRVGD